MDALAESALAALDSTITELLPESVPSGLTRMVRVLPDVVRPSGLGGYVGLHPDPHDAIYGRKFKATLQVNSSGGNDNAATTYLGGCPRIERYES